jgi:transposase
MALAEVADRSEVRRMKALGELFLQVLKLCETAGLVKLGHVALDGTKIKARSPTISATSCARW